MRHTLMTLRKAGLCPGPGWAIAVSLVALMVAGCATDPVALEVRPASIPAVHKVQRSVAFLHGKGFREDIRGVDPYRNRSNLPLKVGEAGDLVLRRAYSQVFAAVREVASREEARSLDTPGGVPITVIEPGIERLAYINAGLRGPFYAEVRYRFRLTQSDGAEIAAWTVRGFGHFDPEKEPGRRNEREILIEAPRRAIESSASNFARAFQRVPELVRWAAGRPTAGADAPAAQITRSVPSGTPEVEGSYPGVLTLLARREALPRPPADVSGDEAGEPAIVPLRLTLRNDSGRRLALDPAEIEWLVQGGDALTPLPGEIVAAVLTGRGFRMSIAPMGPGLAALPALFAALATAASAESKKRELAAWSDSLARDLMQDSITSGGGPKSGLIYFLRPPIPLGGELVVPVIDLDEAVRYTVRLPFPL